MKTTKEELAQARIAFDAWVKSLDGQGVVPWEFAAEGRNPFPHDWDDLDADQQDTWIDVARVFLPSFDAFRAEIADAQATLDKIYALPGVRAQGNRDDVADCVEALIEHHECCITETEHAGKRLGLDEAAEIVDARVMVLFNRGAACDPQRAELVALAEQIRGVR